MAENSKIEWTDHTLHGRLIWAPKLKIINMDALMAIFAEGHAVPNIKSQFWMFGKRANVVSVEIATTVVAAMNAGKAIPQEHVVSPPFQFEACPLPAPFCALPVNVPRRVFSAGSGSTQTRADLDARFHRMFRSNPITISLSPLTHYSLGFVCVMAVFEGAGAALCTLSLLDARASETLRGFPITTRSIATESVYRVPAFSFRTALHAVGNELTILVNRQAALFCSYFQCTFGSLSHGHH